MSDGPSYVIYCARCGTPLGVKTVVYDVLAARRMGLSCDRCGQGVPFYLQPIKPAPAQEADD